MGFIVALNRDRDSYQVARALAEVDSLDRLVTDYYDGAWPIALPNLKHRRAGQIAPSTVTTSLQAFAAQIPYELGRRFSPIDFPSSLVESALGRTTARIAASLPDSDLLLYSGAARQAFAGSSRGRRILFQYHPSPHFVERSMVGVDEMEDWRPWQDEAEISNVAMQTNHRAETERADQVLCASGFTRRGLLQEGVAEQDIAVVPYGCPPVQHPPVAPAPTRPEFLFVGQGVRRKGLHLLVEAWRHADLTDARLTVVASRLDDQIRDLTRGVPNLTFRSRLSDKELAVAMASADTLLLPSLVEGFGLVLGEALSAGCRLLATTHTGLVDMGLPQELATVIEPGRIEPLRQALVAHRDSFDPTGSSRDAARQAAAERGWESFRAGIRRAVGIEEIA